MKVKYSTYFTSHWYGRKYIIEATIIMPSSYEPFMVMFSCKGSSYCHNCDEFWGRNSLYWPAIDYEWGGPCSPKNWPHTALLLLLTFLLYFYYIIILFILYTFILFWVYLYILQIINEALLRESNHRLSRLKCTLTNWATDPFSSEVPKFTYTGLSALEKFCHGKILCTAFSAIPPN